MAETKACSAGLGGGRNRPTPNPREVQPVPATEPPAKTCWFARLKGGLARSSSALSADRWAPSSASAGSTRRR